MTRTSRREFLRRTGAFSLVGGAAAPFALNLAALGAAAAQRGGADYRALVCVFLYGGNDAYNTVLATDADSWARYTAARNQAPDPIALAAVGVPGNPAAGAGLPARLGGVLPLTPPPMRRTRAAASRCIRCSAACATCSLPSGWRSCPTSAR